MTSRHQAGSPLVIGSWPGPSFNTNDFVKIYASAIAAAGCHIVDLPNPMRSKGHLDILHIHWPEQLLWQGGSRAIQVMRIIRAAWAINRMRRAGTRIVWMMHNIRPHELTSSQAVLWRLIERLIIPQIDGLMTLSPATLSLAQATHPSLAQRPALAVYHPAFPATYTPTRSVARAAIGVEENATMLAIVGFLRPYKGLEELITCFRANPDPDKRLVLAGRCTPEYACVLRDLIADDERIRLEARALDEQELITFTTAADWIVLPFRSYMHSGSMVHALSFNRPVLTPRAPFSADLNQITGCYGVRMYDGDLTPELLADLQPYSITADLSLLQPSAIGRRAADFYAHLSAAA